MDIDSIIKIIQLVIREGGQLAALAQRALNGDPITDAEIDAASAERKAAVAAWDAAQDADKQ